MATVVSVQWAAGAETPPGCRRSSLNALIRRAVRTVLADAAVMEAEMSVTLLDDDAIADLNRQHLGHAGVTDVIAFALWDGAEDPVGDIYVGASQAQRQAASLGIDTAEEIVRLAVHGTLHVLGHDHGEGEERVQGAMWMLQERLVREVLPS
jgi:probable rRNA maturation factor